MKTPLILFIGMPDSGKTMATYSLAEYLTTLKDNYDVLPDYSFVPHDGAYKEKCDEFYAKLKMNKPRIGTDQPRIAMDKTLALSDTFLKINVNHKGITLYDILEIPGEKIFNPDDLSQGISKDIISLINPQANDRGKIVFVLLLDLYTRGWDNDNIRTNDAVFQPFVDRLKDIMTNFRDGDKVIALLNQYDKSLNPANDWQKWESAYSSLFEKLSEKKKWIFFDFIKVYKLPYSCGYNFRDNIDPKTNNLILGMETIYNSDKRTMSYARNLWNEITRKWTRI